MRRKQQKIIQILLDAGVPLKHNGCGASKGGVIAIQLFASLIGKSKVNYVSWLGVDIDVLQSRLSRLQTIKGISCRFMQTSDKVAGSC